MSTRRDSTTDKRQKNQYRLAFPEESRGAAPMASVGGTESELAKRRAESPTTEQWIEEVCERENCKQALRRVKANKGSPGIDRMNVEQLSGHLKEHWPAIREQLLSGTYRPQPVKRVEIPKPDGGVRKLGIPTVLDRFIQQAVMQGRKSWSLPIPTGKPFHSTLLSKRNSEPRQNNSSGWNFHHGWNLFQLFFIQRVAQNRRVLY
jgi:hypothetical protein